MTSAVHPFFRRLCASGAAAGRLHSSLERAERSMDGVTFTIEALPLLDDSVLAPLTRETPWTSVLTRSAVPPSQDANREQERTARSSGPLDATVPFPPAVPGARAAPASQPRATRSTVPRATKERFSPDTPQLREARAAVARRLSGDDALSTKWTGANAKPAPPTRGGERLRVAGSGAAIDGEEPKHARASNAQSSKTNDGMSRALNAQPVDSQRVPAHPARFVAPVRVGAASARVTELLRRAAAEAPTSVSGSTVAARDDFHGERGNVERSNGVPSSSHARPSADAPSEILSRLQRVASQAGQRGDHNTRKAVSEPSRDADAAESATSGLRRLIARAGVTPESLTPPPSLGVTRAEGLADVAADRLDESAFARRLGRVLRREARREGIDLDGADT